MAILILGLILFLGIHLVPAIPSLRNSLYDKFGEKTYKGVFSLISAIGLVLIIIGYARAPSEPRLFAPFIGAIHAAPLVMIVSFVLLASANMKTHIRRTLKHPMLIGIGLWALVHLLANEHAKASILFGAFLAYAVIDFISATQRHAVKVFIPMKKYDVIALGSGIMLALLVMTFHRLIFGVKVVPWGV